MKYGVWLLVTLARILKEQMTVIQPDSRNKSDQKDIEFFERFLVVFDM